MSYIHHVSYYIQTFFFTRAEDMTVGLQLCIFISIISGQVKYV